MSSSFTPLATATPKSNKFELPSSILAGCFLPRPPSFIFPDVFGELRLLVVLEDIINKKNLSGLVRTQKYALQHPPAGYGGHAPTR